MTEMKKKKARWFGLLLAAFFVMAYVGPVHLWVMPICLAFMFLCVIRGGLTDWDGIK